VHEDQEKELNIMKTLHLCLILFLFPGWLLAPTFTEELPRQNTVLGKPCLLPPADYQRLLLGRHTVSARTAWMLDNAQALYRGRGSMRLLVQGSHVPGFGPSFGTHDGGGAVDVWAVNPDNRDELLTDIPEMVVALRLAGFAAWYRPADMLYQGMLPHIHAIAIGDSELSPAARTQIEGPDGYFAGRNGLPDAAFAGPDPHGGPILCDWMATQGYRNFRQAFLKERISLRKEALMEPSLDTSRQPGSTGARRFR
jgi:hypothetical protein